MNNTNILLAFPESESALAKQLQNQLDPLEAKIEHTFEGCSTVLQKDKAHILVLNSALLGPDDDLSFITTHNPPASTIILCNDTEREYWEKLIPETIDEYFVSPFNSAQLIRHIHRSIRNIENTGPDYLFRNLNDAVFLAEVATGLVVDVNKMGEQLLGRRRTDIIGMHQAELHPENMNKIARDTFQVHAVRSNLAPVEIEVIRADGQLVWTEISASHIVIEGRAHILGVFHDITSRKNIQKALENSTKWYRGIFDAMPYGGQVLNRLGIIEEVSTRTCTLLGYSKDELIGKPIAELLAEDDLSNFRQNLIQVLNNKTVKAEIHLKHKNGTLVPVLRSARLIEDKSDHNRILAIDLEISDLKEAQTALAISEAKFRTYFEQAHDAIMLVDETGIVVGWNKQSEVLTGRLAIDNVGQRAWDVQISFLSQVNQNPDAVAQAKQVILEALKTGVSKWPSQKIEIIIQHSDGTFKTIEQSMNLIKTPIGHRLSITSVDVTELVLERKKSAQTLKLLEDSQQVAKIGSLFYDLKKKEWTCTQVIEEMLELPPDFPKKIENWLERVVSSPNAVFNHFINQLENYEDEVFEFKYQMKRISDNALIWVKHTGSCGRGSEGQVVNFTSTVQDITEPKLQSESLRRSERRLKTSQKLARLGTYAADPVGDTLTANSIFSDIAGLDNSIPMTYSSWLALIHPDDRDRIEKMHADRDQGQKVLENEVFRIVDKLGTKIQWVNSLTEYHLDGSGKLKRISGTIQDITPQKETEAALRKLTFAMQQSPASTVITDTKGNIEYVNAKFIEISGYTEAEILGENPRILSSGEMSGAEYKEMWDTVLAGGVWQGEFHNKRKNGELYWEWAVISPIRDETGTITQILAVKEDITQRKLDLEKQQSLQEQLNRAQRMEAIGTLAGGIAHDFNNILQSMYLYLGMAQDALPDGYVKDDIAQVSKAANRAKELVGQILTYSRRGAAEQSDVLIQYVIKEGLKFLKSSLPVSVKLYEEINTECWPVYCDPTHIHQIFMNIGTNAFDALPDSMGTIKVTLDMVEITEDKDVKVIVASGTYVQLTISDTGHGIPPTILPKIFNPFFSTKEPGMGTGLGLSVAHGIMEEMGGQIWAESVVGEGSTFKILLPAVQKSDEVIPDTSKITLKFEQLSILLIVSDENIRRGTQRTLEKIGCHVVSCETGQDLLEMLNKYPETFSLILADQNLVDMPGLRLAEKVKQDYSEISFILMTGSNYNEQTSLQGLHHVDAVLKKPWHTEDLLTRISEVLNPDENN